MIFLKDETTCDAKTDWKFDGFGAGGDTEAIVSHIDHKSG